MTALQKSAISSAVGAGVGGLGGMFLAKKKIAEEEKRIGRPLTTQEKDNIKKKYIARGTVGGGLVAGGATLGTQMAANKGNAHAKKIMGTVDNLGEKISQGKHNANRLFKKYVGGIQYEDQDRIEAMQKGLNSDKDAAQKQMDERGWQSLTPEQKALVRENQENILDKSNSRVNFIKNLGMTYLSPLILGAAGTGITKLLNSGQLQPNELDQKIHALKKQGYTDQEIGQILKRQYGE